MLNIKKYSNGRFFDTAAKKYIQPEKLAEMIKKGEKIKVTLTKTGKDITETVIAQFSKKEAAKKETKAKNKKEIPFLKTDKLKKWLGEMVDEKIEQVMDIINLPSRDQVAKLDENIKALNKKIDALTLSKEKTAKKTAAPKKKAAVKKPAPKKAAEVKKPAAEKAADAIKPAPEKPEEKKTEMSKPEMTKPVTETKTEVKTYTKTV